VTKYTKQEILDKVRSIPFDSRRFNDDIEKHSTDWIDETKKPLTSKQMYMLATELLKHGRIFHFEHPKRGSHILFYSEQVKLEKGIVLKHCGIVFDDFLQEWAGIMRITKRNLQLYPQIMEITL
jgi:hypothetical protein